MISLYRVVVALTIAFTVAGFVSAAGKRWAAAFTLWGMAIAMFWGYYLGEATA